MSILNVHDEFEHGGFSYLITDIRVEENGNGKSIFIRAVDPDMAEKEQRKDIEKEKIVDNMTSLLNKLTKGDIGGMGFFGGGM